MVVPRSYNPPASNLQLSALQRFILHSAQLRLEQGTPKISPPTKKRHWGAFFAGAIQSIHPKVYQQYSRPRHKTGILGFVENGWGSSQETLAGFKHSVIFGSFTIRGHLQRPRAREEWHPTDCRQWTASQCDQMSVVQLLDMQSFGKKNFSSLGLSGEKEFTSAD